MLCDICVPAVPVVSVNDTAPLAFSAAPNAIEVPVKETVPADVKEVVVVMLLLFVTDKLANVAPLLPRLSAYPELTTVALPVVLTVRIGVDMLILPMVPEPEESNIDVDPVNVPDVSSTFPEPLALAVTTVPLVAAPS